MEFSEKLMNLRRREGLSQEQLADRLGVTRQSVSKWEGGSAMPELVKLIALSEMFGVSVDYLVKSYAEEEGPAAADGRISAQQAARLEQKMDDLAQCVNGTVYAYDSRRRIFGLPLVSVRIGSVRRRRMSREDVACGIIAIGNAAVGVVSLGLVSVGLFSFGGIALGLLALGMVAVGPGNRGAGVSGPWRQRHRSLCRRRLRRWRRHRRRRGGGLRKHGGGLRRLRAQCPAVGQRPEQGSGGGIPPVPPPQSVAAAAAGAV